MRPIVAIVSARPETIADDYRRLFDLADFGQFTPKDTSICAVEAGGGSGLSGPVCPPWQVEAMVKHLTVVNDLAEESAPAGTLLPVSHSGPFAKLRGMGWDAIVDHHGLQPMAADTLSPAPFRPAGLLPALEAVLPQGFRISPHLRGKNLFMLSTMSLESGGKLAANVALLASMLAGQRKSGGKTPLVEVMTEVVGLAREVFVSIRVVTDATVVSVVRQGGARVTLVRNLLVAGNDPVAVDSVLGKLAGVDPGDSAWLKLCQERGLGVADLGAIRLVGETQWLDLDFQIPEDTFASGNAATPWSARGLLRRVAGQESPGKSNSLESAWERLYRDYQSGVTS